MNKLLLSFLLLYVVVSCSCPDKVSLFEKETFLYSVKGQDSLYLDRYVFTGTEKPKACVIFLFGGGFVGGERNAKYYTSYFNTLAEAGYTVVSIDYRLGLRNASKETIASPEQFAGTLKFAVDIAVEDLYDATNYILSCEEEWNIDPSCIIVSGSSAGAVTVLQAEYEIVNKTALMQRLPDGFNYAGVVSFAGAILSFSGDLTLNTETCPIMLFHGNADANVPYDKAVMGDFGLYGSKHIANKLKENNLPYYFYGVNNAAHEIAGTPMSENIDEIMLFIDKFVLRKQQLSIESTVEQIGKLELKKDFELNDYITTNYGE